jgi:hypothetical protein
VTEQGQGQQPFPERAIELSRLLATKHVRSDRFAYRFWAVVWGAGFLAFLGVSIGGAFTGPDAIVGEIILGALVVLCLYATVVESSGRPGR